MILGFSESGMMATHSLIEEFEPGATVGVSDWLTLRQAQINLFADATLDQDPMHVDPAWAATSGPFGGTVSFGFLTLSLLTYFSHQILESGPASSQFTPGTGYGINYGLDRVRFMSPVPVDSRIRAHMRLLEARIDHRHRLMVKFEVTIEIEGQEKPALVAEWLWLWEQAAA